MATKRSPAPTPADSASSRKRDRLAVTLTPESKAALDRLQASGGMAAASFVSVIVHESIPAIEALAHTFENAKKSPREALEKMRDVAASVLVNSAQASLDLDDAVRPRRKIRRRRTPS